MILDFTDHKIKPLAISQIFFSDSVNVEKIFFAVVNSLAQEFMIHDLFDHLWVISPEQPDFYLKVLPEFCKKKIGVEQIINHQADTIQVIAVNRRDASSGSADFRRS